MKKTIRYILCTAAIMSTTLSAAEATAPASVGKAAQEGSNTGKSSRWAQYTVAGVAVAIAVTAIVLIAKHKDSHHGSSHAHS